jgi:hypothetical protein
MNRLVAVAIGLFLSILPDHAKAHFVFTISQVGDDVRVIGSGSIDLGGFSFLGEDHAGPDTLGPAAGELSAGEWRLGPTEASVGLYQGFPSGPFGSGAATQDVAETSGDYVGFGGSGLLLVPGGYVSGAHLSNSTTFADVTLASLGLSAGQTVYTFGSGDTVTVSVVPEPATSALIALGGISLFALRRRRTL